MKKLLMIAAFAACAFGMNAQLYVLKSGKVQIGNSTPSLIANPTYPKAVTTITVTDSLASLTLLKGTDNGGGAYITFGNVKNVAVGEYSPTTTPVDSDILGLFGSKGIKYLAGSKEVFSYSPILTTNPFTFNCNVKASSYLTTSDARMKKDVCSISGASSLLSEISPVSYRLADTTEAKRASAVDEAETMPMSPDDRVQYGFIAQEVREIFPELVVEDEDGYLSIDYTGFIPILVDAYKALETRVQEQEEALVMLAGNNARKSPTTGLDGILADGKALLLQNRPNPFRESTMIECVVPNGSAEAFVCVYDLQGTQVKRMNIEERGNCTITIDGSTLKPGMYIYALIIDGTEIDTKKMILTD